jgi:hypothetical protein
MFVFQICDIIFFPTNIVKLVEFTHEFIFPKIFNFFVKKRQVLLKQNTESNTSKNIDFSNL